MRAVLTNFGTVGDFRPLLTLASELASHGHTCVLAFPPFARSMAAHMPFAFAPLGPDLAALRDHVNISWAEMPDIYQSADQMLALLMPFREAFDQIFRELKHSCEDADVLISGPAQPLARMVHEVTGIPFVSIQLSHFGGSGGPALRDAGDQLINPFRQKLGLAPVNDPLTLGANSPQLAIYAMSAHLRPRPADWPSHFHLTGFFADPKESLGSPGPELEEFVMSGPAPVVITLGSLAHSEPGALAELLRDSALMAGCRAVIQGIPAESIPSQSSPDIFWAGFAPHSWLFPRAACIVLHGGAGTAAATFRSGVPGIFVPHGDCYDQRYWGQLAVEAGCSVPAIPYSDLTAANLAEAIKATLDSQQLRAAAASLGAKIRREPGVRLAGRLITEFVARVGLCREYVEP